MDNCGNCAHFTHNNLHGWVCNKTMKPAGYLQVKNCFEHKIVEPNTNKMNENTTTPQTKVCKRCGRELPVGAFGRHARTKDGLQPLCKECMSKKQKDAWEKSRKDEGHPDVNAIDDRALVAELRKRGYTGTITKQISITL